MTYLDPYAHRRALVLGATGFIGRWVARALSHGRAEVHLGVRNPAAAHQALESYGIRATPHELDALDLPALRALCRRVRPSVTFNLIGYGVDRSETDEALGARINAAFVEALCLATHETRDPSWPGQALVQVGSGFEYGAASGNLSEETVPQPLTWYARTKLAGTEAVAAWAPRLGLSAVTARLFTVYGPGEHPGRLLPSLIDAAASRLAVDLTSGTQRRDFTYVEDVAEGLLRLGVAEAGAGTVCNVATGTLTTIRDFAATAARVLGMPPASLRFGAKPTRPEEMNHTEVTNARLKALTGWVPPTEPAAGIRKTAAFPRGLPPGGEVPVTEGAREREPHTAPHPG